MLKSLRTSLRIGNWWNYKLPPLFAIAYMFIFLLEIPAWEALSTLGLLLLWMTGAAGFGYYLNDCFDIHNDLKAGKPNKASQHSPLLRMLILLLLVIMTYLPWVILNNKIGWLLVTLHILSFVLYSVPPFRLKEKGWMGITLDSFYAHLLPALIVISAFYDPYNFDTILKAIVIVIALWQLFIGCRNIVLHQMEDYENDKTSGVNTWITRDGIGRGQHLNLHFLYPGELVAFFIILCLFTIQGAWLAGILTLLILGLKYIRYRYFHPFFFNEPKHKLFFMNDFYGEDLGVIFLILLITQNPIYLLIFAIHLILFPDFYLRIIKDFKRVT